MTQKHTSWIIFFLLFIQSPAFAVITYQDFEADNGTPSEPYAKSVEDPPQYGWTFNGAAAGLTNDTDPVRSGVRSWKVTIPSGPHVVAGAAIPSQTQTYHLNFVPECHDRLTFWIWSDPATVGDHSVMVKFFDQGTYKHDGIGIWTDSKAQYQKWSKIEILFSQLPSDFDVEHVDKIEFFNYWDGTYFYDDVRIESAFSQEKDMECLEKEMIIVCPPDDAKQENCRSIYGDKGDDVLQLLETNKNGLKE